MVKADIITSLVRKLSTLLCLTKTQNEQLLTFWKTMIVFINPHSRSIVKKVHASYSTCVRQSLKDESEKKRLFQKYMDECLFFAVAIDSTQIRNEHLFSCFARFSFQDSLIQIPMFFDVHHLSTGDGVAHFVFDKLVQFNCSFEKLVCVSSDGASNIIGSSNGMTVAWKRLILQHCAERQISFNEFHSVWCFAHRLNLVTKDLLECERLNVVKAFSDWFSDRRRQVHFKAFLSQKTFNKNSNASHSLRTQDGCFTETL